VTLAWREGMSSRARIKVMAVRQRWTGLRPLVAILILVVMAVAWSAPSRGTNAGAAVAASQRHSLGGHAVAVYPDRLGGHRVWVVEYAGACMPVIGMVPMGTQHTLRPCAGHKAFIAVDAATFSFVQATNFKP